MDRAAVERALALDAAWFGTLRSCWTRAAELAVFGNVQSARIGALPKLRRRVLELGERLASLGADRAWIPQPRAQLKNALAAGRLVRESIEHVEHALAELDRGAELADLRGQIAALRAVLDPVLGACELRWAQLLDLDRASDADADIC